MNSSRNGWQPPHCPNSNCKYHNESAGGWIYRKHGFFTRLIRPHRIQRFTCLDCGRSFSSQTFSVTYWLKRPDILSALLFRSSAAWATDRSPGTCAYPIGRRPTDLAPGPPLPAVPSQDAARSTPTCGNRFRRLRDLRAQSILSDRVPHHRRARYELLQSLHRQ